MDIISFKLIISRQPTNKKRTKNVSKFQMLQIKSTSILIKLGTQKTGNAYKIDNYSDKKNSSKAIFTVCSCTNYK
jgi:hypothetical protein